MTFPSSRSSSSFLFGLGAIMAIGGSTAAPHVDIVKGTRALQQATSPTYSPTSSYSPSSSVSSANTATTTITGTDAATAGGTEVGTTAVTASMTINGTVAITTGTGATVAVGSTSTGATLSSMTTTTGAATSDSESWMVCNKDLAASTSLNSDMLTLYHQVSLAPEGDSRGGIFCGWLERTDGTDGWIGFGMSPTGHMDDGIGMIGLPDDGTVEKYRLYGETPYVKRMSDGNQTLMFTSITQDQDGTTHMEFAKFLNEEDEIPILANGDNTFLYALGSSNALGYHSSGMDYFNLGLETPAASSTATSATISATTVTDTASTTFAIEATATAPSNEESTKPITTPAPMEFASGDKSTASAIARVAYSISGVLALYALLNF